MKQVGIVKEYNGYTGNIKGVDGKNYILMNKDIVDNEKLNVDDHVIFEPEEYKSIEINNNIARFVKTLEKEKNTNKYRR